MVVAASRKYPNPYSSHVRSLDTLHRKTSGRRLYSHRLIGAMWNIPASISSIIFGVKLEIYTGSIDFIPHLGLVQLGPKQGQESRARSKARAAV